MTRKTLSLKIVFICLSLSLGTALAKTADTDRARDLGIPFEGQTGPLNAITDVAGVEVGHVTLIEGNGQDEDLGRPGKGPVRTGVTAILPRGKSYDPVLPAGMHLMATGK